MSDHRITSETNHPVSDRLVQDNLREWDHYQCPASHIEARRYLELAKQLSPGVLLDIGCADGGMSAEFIKLGWDAIGVDISFDNSLAAMSKNVRAIVSLLQEPLPIYAASIDFVIAKEVIEHLVDTRFLLQEIHRVLRPGGALIISTPNLASLSNRLRLLFGKYPGWMDYELGQGAGHVRYYTSPVLRSQLISTGFTIEAEIGTELALPGLGRFLKDGQARVLNYLGEKFPELSPILVMRARKAS